jgi:hypothetical protein
MLNPTDASKSPLSSRIALSLALLLAGIFGLAAAILLPAPTLKKSVVRHSAPTTLAVSEGTPSPERTLMKEGEPPAASTDDLVQFCSKHVTEKRTFVLFRRGTCVVIDEPCTDPLAEARRKLATCAESEAPFVPEPTSEGDLIITFKEPVFHRFTQGELEKLAPWLEQVAPALLSPAESMAAVDGWSPHQNAKVGLLARRRMLEDATQAVPVKIIRAKSRATAAR